MSNNFYAYFHPNGDDSLTFKMHIGKTIGGQVSALCGRFFPTAQAWRDFLTHNDNLNLEIVDENGKQWNSDTFITEYLTKAPEQNRQVDWLRTNNYAISLGPVLGSERRNLDWLDEEGFLIHGGEFS